MKGDKGFTLTELMVSLVISGVLMTAVYAVFNAQEKSYAVQDQLAAATQNLRGAMNLMVREIRMAGYDPQGRAGAGIKDARSDRIEFTLDISGDGLTDGSNEHIKYYLYTTDGIQKLGRLSSEAATIQQPVAENIDGLSFKYLDRDGIEIANPNDNKSSICSIQITLRAKTAKPDPAYKENGGFRTKTLTEQVVCRNLAF
jgi:type IV pilus assembly protein PilW